jgi:hypothetical protein
VTNLARPGGNLTGFWSFEPDMGGKWLSVLKETAANVRASYGQNCCPNFQWPEWFERDKLQFKPGAREDVRT